MKNEKPWRSLDELTKPEEFAKAFESEFPPEAIKPARFDRRQFLSLMSSTLTITGLSACSPTIPEKIVPYVRQPEEIVPGRPLFFATAAPLAGYGVGVLAESHTGRPTKIEGNPDHPDSRSATDAFSQASILDLYDPDRSQVVMQAGRISTWDAFITMLANELEPKRLNGGAGFRILTGTVTSPTLTFQLSEILRTFPMARLHQYEPAGDTGTARYAFEAADIVLSLDADFLLAMPGHVKHARDFAARRRTDPGGSMNRLYVAESTPTITGSMADHRRALRSSDIHGFATRVMEALNGTPSNDPWIDAVAADLLKYSGRSVVVAGQQQPPEVHVIARAMNTSLGNVGRTVSYDDDPDAGSAADPMQSLRELAKDMQGGVVDLLLILEGNPVYTAPADLEFTRALERVRNRIHLSLYDDETSEMCHWHVPGTHFLESWGDIRSYEGAVTIMQPLINPLYGGKSAYEVLAAVLGAPRSAHEIVSEYWRTIVRRDDFDDWWRRSVRDGIAGGNFSFPQIPLPAAPESGQPPVVEIPDSQFEIVFRLDPAVFDGRFANNAWLQELPRPLTKLVWDNAALLSLASARQLEVENGDVIEITSQGRMLRAPVWISPGHADNSISLFLGYGRWRAGRTGSGVGYNAYALRTSTAPGFAPAEQVRKTGERHLLVSTQEHHAMENRALIRHGTPAEYAKSPSFVEHQDHDVPKPPSLYPEDVPEDYAWGMAIDLSTCIGCNACVVACQAENNIPVVGKTEVSRSREMHWLRIDRYYEGSVEDPAVYVQPMLCMHCEKAPCEPVCPVAATSHSSEGLNEMTYNRCVGTRYCSNNCPYKVRRFNFFEYAQWDVPSLKMLYNPDVTLRSRGVMEKCTYCVQRINQARITAKKENRPVRDGEVVTACQQACPADAIVFGNVADPDSRVARLKREPRNYGLLTELNTQPRTTYLAKLTNPNPEIVSK